MDIAQFLDFGGRLSTSRQTLREHLKCLHDNKYLILSTSKINSLLILWSTQGQRRKKKSQGFGFHKHITSASLLFPYLRASWSPASRSCVARAGCAGAGSPHAHTVLPWAVSCKTEPTASYHSSAALARFETWGLLYAWPIVSPNGNNGLVHPPWNQWLKTVITALSLAGMPHGGVLIAHRKYENTLGTPQQLVIYCRALDDVRETTAERLSVLQLGGHLSFQ